MNRSKSAALLMLVGSLAVGGVSGYLIKGYQDRDRPPARTRDERSLRRRAYDELNLDAVQRVKWDSLIDLRNRQVGEVFAPARARAESIRQAINTELRALLTPEQQAKQDEIRKQIQERQRAREAARSGKDGKNKNQNSPR